MTRTFLIVALCLLPFTGCRTKPSPVTPATYVNQDEYTKGQNNLQVYLAGEKKRVDEHENRLTALEAGTSVPSRGLAGVTYVLNPQAPASSTPSIIPASFVTSATPVVTAPIASTPTTPGAAGTLPSCELAMKFGEEFKAFKATTETRFAALDATQNKQGEKIGEHSTALEKLTGEVKQLTEKVDSLKQTTEQPKQAVPGPNPSTPPLAEAPAPS